MIVGRLIPAGTGAVMNRPRAIAAGPDRRGQGGGTAFWMMFRVRWLVRVTGLFFVQRRPSNDVRTMLKQVLTISPANAWSSR